MIKLKKLLLSLVLVATGVLALSVAAPKAHALSGSDFNPGRIIDDSVFFNKDAMSVNDIQNFLYAKSGPCDTNRPTTNSNYQPPWTCLYQYRENTTTHANNIGDPNGNPSGSITGAQIIYDAAQTYSISPKALIVLIQKESSLITDNWPWSNQYRTATGYGCPDTAPCDAQYYGFYNQVNKAAFQFRRYANYPSEYNYKAGRSNNIGYNPNAACGAQTVYIENQATAGLYNYTPYVPNAAALNNLYGTGDGCSAYGNRNFWRLYNDWFGSTQGVPYQWSYVTQSSDKDLTDLDPGDVANVTIVARNTGANTWYNSGSNQVNVVTDRPLVRSSAFADPSWINPTTPARSIESSVGPGQTATFNFKLKAPLQPGTSKEYFSLVAQGITFFNTDVGQYFDVTVNQAHKWSFNSQAAYTDSSKSTPVDLSNMSPGQTAWLVVRGNNTGNVTWYNSGANKTDLATDRPLVRASRFATGAWINSSTPTTLKETSVAPGGVGTFEFPIKAPTGEGTYKEYFNPVAQGIAFFNNDPGQFFNITVKHDYRWSYNSQATYTDSTKATPVNVATTSPGQTAWMVVRANNTGSTTWYNSGPNKIDLATDRPLIRASRFATNAWLSSNTPATLKETSVAPGQVGTFEFPITVPAGAGTFKEYFNPVAQGIAFFNNDPGQFFNITVSHNYQWTYNSQASYTDNTKAVTVNLATMSPGQTAWLVVRANNTGSTTWYNSGANKIDLATDRPLIRASRFATNAWLSNNTPATLKETSVAPGQVGTFEFPITVPAGTGSFREYFNPVAQGIMFFNNDPGQFFNITVQ